MVGLLALGEMYEWDLLEESGTLRAEPWGLYLALCTPFYVFISYLPHHNKLTPLKLLAQTRLLLFQHFHQESLFKVVRTPTETVVCLRH